MTIYHADMGGLWALFLVFFVVVPAIRWGVGVGTGSKWRGRVRRGPWDWSWDEGGRKAAGSADFADLKSQLDERLAEIDGLQGRVAELENRLDFTERLLGQQRDSMMRSHRPSAHSISPQ